MPEISEELTPEEEEYFLNEQEEEQFKSLLTIGKLSGNCVVYGHKIKLETTTVAEDIQLGLILKEFQDSHAFQRAFRTATVAAYVREIDGRPLIQNISMNVDDSTAVADKFEKLKEYYPAVIDEIFAKILELDQKLLPILSRLGKTSS